MLMITPSGVLLPKLHVRTRMVLGRAQTSQHGLVNASSETVIQVGPYPTSVS